MTTIPPGKFPYDEGDAPKESEPRSGVSLSRPVIISISVTCLLSALVAVFFFKDRFSSVDKPVLIPAEVFSGADKASSGSASQSHCTSISSDALPACPSPGSTNLISSTNPTGSFHVDGCSLGSAQEAEISCSTPPENNWVFIQGTDTAANCAAQSSCAFMQASRSKGSPNNNLRNGLMFHTPDSRAMSGAERKVEGLTTGSVYQFRMHASTNTGLTPNGLLLLVSPISQTGQSQNSVGTTIQCWQDTKVVFPAFTPLNVTFRAPATTIYLQLLGYDVEGQVVLDDVTLVSC